MSGDQLVQIVALVMCLVLAWAGLKSHALAGKKGLQMALAWTAVIVALTLGLRLLGV